MKNKTGKKIKNTINVNKIVLLQVKDQKKNHTKKKNPGQMEGKTFKNHH